MLKYYLSAAVIVSSAIGVADMASAATKAKKLTYEQAWEVCRKDLQSTLPGDSAQSAARYTRGAGCMKGHGYRLKRSSL